MFPLEGEISQPVKENPSSWDQILSGRTLASRETLECVVFSLDFLFMSTETMLGNPLPHTTFAFIFFQP